jgi:hypothetical protein
MIFNGHLYNIDALGKGSMKNGKPIDGQLRSIPDVSDCVLNGEHGGGLARFILDDMGGIDLDDLKHVGPCTH